MSTHTSALDIDTVIIFTTRMHQMAEFYRAALMLDAPVAVLPDHIGFRLPRIYLGFDQVAEQPATPGGVTAWFRVDDLDATFANCVRLGARVRYPPTTKPFGDRLASVYDLDGNLIGLAQRQPAKPSQ